MIKTGRWGDVTKHFRNSLKTSSAPSGITLWFADLVVRYESIYDLLQVNQLHFMGWNYYVSFHALLFMPVFICINSPMLIHNCNRKNIFRI